jgi:coproporphyrinogen dehydrogenase HemZ
MRQEMTYIYTDTPNFYNEICEEIRLFISCDKIEMVDRKFSDFSKDDLFFIHKIIGLDKGKYQSIVYLQDSEKNTTVFDYEQSQDDSEIISKKKRKYAVKLSFYFFLKAYTKKTMPWGSLTGIRPTKMLRELIKDQTTAYALSYMANDLDLTQPKLDLAHSIVKRQKSTIATIDKNSIDVYINIPFCPSICHYCSFSSTKTSEGSKLQRSYIQKLKTEITQSLPLLKDKHIRSIYIGGGTPTSLDIDILEDLLFFVQNTFEKPDEYTVEAGRPDTLSDQCLFLLKQFGVDRISINPQTMKQKTLVRIGRDHTVKQFKSAYKRAKKLGLNNINVDLIFGLPGEKKAAMKKSLKKVLRLKPQSITVHTLAIKNASQLKKQTEYKTKREKMEKIIAWSQKKCRRKGYGPYYMYRQKYMTGNLENVGYAKAGFDSIYNIDMMEEVCSVIAFGAGAISKRVYLADNRIVRSPNVKDVKTYIARYADMIERKQKLFL